MDLLIRKRLREQFAQSSVQGPAILAFLDDNGLELNRIELLRDGPDFFAFLALSPYLQGRFGLQGDEILLLVLHRARQEQWFLSEISSKLGEHGRASRSAVLVVSPDERIVTLCRNASLDSQAGYKTAHVAFSVKDIRAAVSQEERSTLLYEGFRRQAFVIDHFDARGPVPDDLFGRHSLAAQVEADLRMASEGVAILGIRRVGKTSVLKRVLQQLQDDPEEWWVIGYYDAQGDTVEASLETVISRFEASLRQAALLRSRPIPALPKGLSSAEQLRAVLDYLITQESFRVVLAIDEMEWLVPVVTEVNAKKKGDDALVLFGTLRSLKQKYGRQLALVLCGTNETICEMAEINGRPNPNLDWYRPHYAALLSKEESATMLRALARRMGLDLADDFIDSVWRAFGGHAYLSRQFCSEAVRGVTQRPVRITQVHYDAHYSDFMDRASGIFEAILKHLAQFYPEEYELLRDVSMGKAIQRRAGMALRHLRSYGLVDEENGQLRVALSSLATFVSEYSAEEVRRERFRLIAPLGSGATSTVWRAFDNDAQSDCALKIFQGDVAEDSVARELRVMQEIGSRYVPRPLGIVRYEDQAALQMEYIGGKPLESVLKEQTRILGGDLLQLSHHLFESISSLHPQRERIERLRQTAEVSPLAGVELFDLMGRGYLHRDLKPANVIVQPEMGWEVRVIDLGLMVPANRAGLSRVGTPDYLPPDVGVSRWDVTFDLYALGRILSRCVFGELVSHGDVDARCAVVGEAYREAVRLFFGKALNPSASERYLSVESMKKDWADASLAFL